MSQGANGTTSSGPEESSSIQAIEADIAQTRADLADTVDQLAAKLDVKTRTKERVHDVSDQVTHTVGAQARALRDRATDSDGRPTKAMISAGGAAAAVVVAVVALVVWRRSR